MAGRVLLQGQPSGLNLPVIVTPAQKAALTKSINYLRAELTDRKVCKGKGWTEYLGEPIDPQINALERELFSLEARKRRIALLSNHLNNGNPTV